MYHVELLIFHGTDTYIKCIQVFYFKFIFQKGRVFEHKHKYEEAKSCYENALSINPAHTKSLQHLVSYFINFKTLIVINCARHLFIWRIS